MNDNCFCWQVAVSGVRITHTSGRKLFVLRGSRSSYTVLFKSVELIASCSALPEVQVSHYLSSRLFMFGFSLLTMTKPDSKAASVCLPCQFHLLEMETSKGLGEELNSSKLALHSLGLLGTLPSPGLRQRCSSSGLISFIHFAVSYAGIQSKMLPWQLPQQMVFDQSLSYRGDIQQCFWGLHILSYHETQSGLNHDWNVKFSICLQAPSLLFPVVCHLFWFSLLSAWPECRCISACGRARKLPCRSNV